MILDRSQLKLLEEACEGEPEGAFTELLGEFYANALGKIAELRALSAETGYSDFGKIAHGMKGLCLNFGAAEMAEECSRLEHLPESVFRGEMARVPETLLTIFDRTRIAIDTYTVSSGASHG